MACEGFCIAVQWRAGYLVLSTWYSVRLRTRRCSLTCAIPDAMHLPSTRGTLLAPKAFRAAAAKVQPSLVRIEGFGGIAAGAAGGGYQAPGEGPTTGLIDLVRRLHRHQHVQFPPQAADHHGRYARRAPARGQAARPRRDAEDLPSQSRWRRAAARARVRPQERAEGRPVGRGHRHRLWRRAEPCPLGRHHFRHQPHFGQGRADRRQYQPRELRRAARRSRRPRHRHLRPAQPAGATARRPAPSGTTRGSALRCRSTGLESVLDATEGGQDAASGLSGRAGRALRRSAHRRC